jgi:hypothetical protein
MEFSVIGAMAVFGQQLGKQVPTSTDMNTTIEGWCFLCGPCQDVISEG